MNGPAILQRIPPWLSRLIVGTRPKRTLIRAAALIVASFIVFKFILLPIRVEGVSMVPTYRDGSINFVNKLAYRWAMPQRGDVVALRMAGEHVMVLKRIVGLPGERVTLRGGRIYINDEELHEDYVKMRRPFWQQSRRDVRSESWTLGPDEYFFIGDNRAVLGYAHYKGAGSIDRIVGKALF